MVNSPLHCLSMALPCSSCRADRRTGRRQRTRTLAITLSLVAAFRLHFALTVVKVAFLFTFGASLPAVAQSPKATPNFAEVVAKANAARDADRIDEAARLYRQAVTIRPA